MQRSRQYHQSCPLSLHLAINCSIQTVHMAYKCQYIVTREQSTDAYDQLHWTIHCTWQTIHTVNISMNFPLLAINCSIKAVHTAYRCQCIVNRERSTVTCERYNNIECFNVLQFDYNYLLSPRVSTFLTVYTVYLYHLIENEIQLTVWATLAPTPFE